MVEKYLFKPDGEKNLECSNSRQKFGFDLRVTKTHTPKLKIRLQKENFVNTPSDQKKVHLGFFFALRALQFNSLQGHWFLTAASCPKKDFYTYPHPLKNVQQTFLLRT